MKTIMISLSFVISSLAFAGDNCQGTSDRDPAGLPPFEASLPADMNVYTDFSCRFCKKGAELVERLQETYGDGLKINIIAYPVLKDEEGKLAAKYFEAVKMLHPRRAIDFYMGLYKLESKKEKSILKLVKMLGMSKRDIKIAAHSAAVENNLLYNKNEGARVGVRGVPFFMIDERHSISGARPFSYFEQIFGKKPNC